MCETCVHESAAAEVGRNPGCKVLFSLHVRVKPDAGVYLHTRHWY